MPTYKITNSSGQQGRAWDATYSKMDDAISAVMDAMGWSEMTVSEPYTVRHDGCVTDAWSVYATKAEHDADTNGAHAPRIVQVPESDVASATD